MLSRSGARREFYKVATLHTPSAGTGTMKAVVADDELVRVTGPFSQRSTSPAPFSLTGLLGVGL
jgi:hypothetical protein